jgi:cytochrome b
MTAGLVIMTVGLAAVALLTARMCSGVIREQPDRLAGIALLTIAASAVAGLINGLAFR